MSRPTGEGGRYRQKEGASWASTDAIRRTMVGNRGRDTAPELAVRRLLHAQGMRYRVNYRPEFMRRRSVDIAFTRVKLACFVDGCFWHGCPEHYIRPRSNEHYWLPKIEANRSRDRDSGRMLQDHGWTVLRFWEHEDPSEIVVAVHQAWQVLS